MSQSSRRVRHIFPALGGALAVLAGCAPEVVATATSARGLPGDGLVISAIYGSGGLSGATFNQDFVELFNRSTAPVPLGGLSIQYGSFNGDFGNNASGIIPLPASATVAPGQYFLVALATGAVGSALPAADHTNTPTNMSGSNGKVALARITTSLACGGSARCPRTNVVDMVGYGTATDYEGAAAMVALAAARTGNRRLAGCQDTDSSSADFELMNPAAVPRNSASPLNVCAATPVDAGVVADDAAVVGPDAAADDATVVVNPDAAADDATVVVNPDAAADDATVVVNPDAAADDATVVVNPDAAADDATVVVNPDAAADDATVVVTPDASADDAAVVTPDASDDAGVIVIADASDDAGAPADAGADDAAVVTPDAGFDPNAGTGLVISQVYGAGGNNNAVLTHDFVELFNRSTVPVSLANLSIQYGSANGNYANPLANGMPGTGLTVLPADAVVEPGRYFLVRMSGGTNGSTIAFADFDGPSNLSGTSGKVALARVPYSLGCGGMTPCAPGDIIDRVGYGTPSDFEGSAAAPALTPATSAQRLGQGCVDTDVNVDDFITGAPAPRASNLPPVDCTAVAVDGGVGLDATLPPDAQVGDSGVPVDSGSPVDSGARDSGVVDTGSADDAGTVDSGATTTDAGPVADGGTTPARDAGTAARDAGAGPEQIDSGCGCSTGRSPTVDPVAALALVLGLGLIRRRRARAA